jgi:peptide/nickel transport system substrate-binding protein
MKRYIKTLLPITAILALVLAAIACSSADEAAPAAPAAQQAAPAAPTAAPAAVSAPTSTPPPSVPKVAEPQEADATLGPPESNAKRGGFLNYGWVASPPHLDLHQSGTTNNCTPQCPLYDLLVMNDPTDQARSIINAGLAHSWEVSSDGKDFTFKLREGVKFHDGADMTSADVKATFDRIIFPPDHVSSRRQTLFTSVESVEAPDDFTVSFMLKEARSAGYILQSIASGFNVIVRKQTLDDSGSDLRKIPDYPGTGPFRYVSHIDAEEWRTEKFPDYWNPELPYLDGINTFHICAFCQQLVAAFIANQIDYARGIDPKTWLEWQTSPPEGTTTVRFPQTTVIAAFINQANEGPLQDVRVRKAIHTVIDRDAIIEGAKDISPMSPGFGFIFKFSEFAASEEELRMRQGNATTTEKGPEIELAKQILEDAGYADGIKGLRIRYTNNAYSQVWGPMVAQMIGDIGIEVEQVPSEYPIWIETTESGDYDISVGPVAFPFGDPSSYLRTWYGCDGPTNFGKFCDEEVDSLIDQIDSELDPVARKKLVTEVDLLLEERVPFAPLSWEEFTDAHYVYVKGHAVGGSIGLYNAERRGTWWLDK